MATLIEYLMESKDKKELSEKIVIKLLEYGLVEDIKHLELDSIIKKLVAERVLNYEGKVIKSSVKYRDYFPLKDTPMTIDDIVEGIETIYRGKIGIAAGRKYPLLDSRYNIRKEIVRFKELYEIEGDDIIKAMEYYFNKAKKIGTSYKYAPRVCTFINGNDKNRYLLNYVARIQSTEGEESVVPDINEGVYTDV